MSSPSQAKFPPGPSTGLRGWRSGPMGGDPLTFFMELARDYGDVAGLRMLNFRTIFINHPDAIEDLLVNHARKYTKGRVLRANRRVFGEGLLPSEGDFWLRQRRLAQPAFHRARIAAYAATMVEYTERLLLNWRDGDERDAHQEMTRRTLGSRSSCSSKSAQTSAAPSLSRSGSPRPQISASAAPCAKSRTFSTASSPSAAPPAATPGICYPCCWRRRTKTV